MADKPTREEAWTILSDHVKSPSLQPHALAVEAVMRHVARKKSADADLWVVIGLVHDLDYEEHPDKHLRHAPEILRSQEWPEEHIRAIASHGWGLFTDVAKRPGPLRQERPEEVKGQDVCRGRGPHLLTSCVFCYPGGYE